MGTTPEKKGRKGFQGTFLHKLSALSGDNARTVSNEALRKALNWDKEKYDRVKQELISLDVIDQGPGGGGGTLRRPQSSKGQALKVFVSYSHADKSDRDDLVKHLTPLKHLGLVDHWDDQEIEPGERFEKTISDQLAIADVVLLLISADFINSDYCYNKEMVEAMELERSGNARVIPILLRDCIWQYTPFRGLQMVAGAKPIAHWPSRDAAFKAIVEDIKKAVDHIIARRQSV